MAEDQWTPETPWFGPDKDTEKVWPRWTCRRASCPSFGKSHPNCKCGPPSLSTTYRNLEYAKGGEVYFCDTEYPHEKGCEFYAEGGPVSVPAQAQPQDDTSATVGHAAITHGLLGLLKDVGRVRMASPGDQTHLLEDAIDAHLSRANPGLDAGGKETVGRKLGAKLFHGEHSDAAELIHGTPLVGSTPKSHLEPILARLAGPLMEKSVDPEAFRSSVEYLSSAAKGAKTLDDHVKGLFGKDSKEVPANGRINRRATDNGLHGKAETDESSQSSTEGLEKFLDMGVRDPSSLYDIGGNLGHYLPVHAGALAGHAGAAITYLDKLKPKGIQRAPLDEPSPENPVSRDAYDRALDVAQQPLVVLNHIRDGTLAPGDVTALMTMYPGLYKSMKAKLGEELIDLKTRGEELSYRHALSLSMALGQPLDSTMTAQSMQAIISSQAPAQMPQVQPGSKKGPKGAALSAATQKTMRQTDQLAETPLDHLAERHP